MSVVCAIPIVRINADFRLAIKSLFALEHSDICYLLYFDHVRIESERDIFEWKIFENFLFSSQRWAANQVTLVGSTKKNGLIGSWNESARLGWSLCKSPKYFFWGSDHDVWSPNFLDFPLQVFNDHTSPRLAVPQCGDLREGKIKRIEPANTQFGAMRFHGPFAPGYSIYGVFNIASFPQLPNNFLPDRLFLSKFSLRNSIVGQNSPQIMYLRRRVIGEEFSVQRQSKNLWGGKTPFPHKLRFPWWCSHILSLSSTFLQELFKNRDKKLIFWYSYMVIDRLKRSNILVFLFQFKLKKKN